MRFPSNQFRFRVALTIAASATMTLSFGAYAAVSVTFTNSDQYADMPFTQSGKDEVLNSLRNHFEKLGAKLPAGQDLKIDVSDVDLAGSIEPARASTNADFRILRGGADWPMIKFKFVVEGAGKVIKSGEARVTDLNYLRGFNHYRSSESLRYEKAMLDDWFARHIASAKK